MNLQQITLKLQFLDDSKEVNLPIHTSLMPSPKVHTQIPKVKPLPLILPTVVIAIGWCYTVRFLLKAPCVAEKSPVNVINHPACLFLYVHSVNTSL